MRDKLLVVLGTPVADLDVALQLDNVRKWLEDRTPRKVIVVPDKLVNIVMA